MKDATERIYDPFQQYFCQVRVIIYRYIYIPSKIIDIHNLFMVIHMSIIRGVHNVINI